MSKSCLPLFVNEESEAQVGKLVCLLQKKGRRQGQACHLGFQIEATYCTCIPIIGTLYDVSLCISGVLAVFKFLYYMLAQGGLESMSLPSINLPFRKN